VVIYMSALKHTLSITTLCVMISFSSSVIADDLEDSVHEVSFGVLDHDTDNLWSGFSRESGVDINAEVLFNSVYHVLGGHIHPAVGASINTGGDTSKIYAGLRYR
jgi:lipid A 3-O-deacylase